MGPGIIVLGASISSLHVLRVNTTVLAPALRPPLWRRLTLVAMALFYGSLIALWVGSMLG